MKKIIFLPLIMVMFYASAQTPAKKTQPVKPQAKKDVADQQIINTASGSSLIIPINYKGALTAPTASQATDRLLWYNGKKLNDSMLITPQASLILYSKKRGMVVVQPDQKKDPSKKIIEKMKAITKQKNELIETAAAKQNGFFLYAQVTNTIKKFDQQNAELENILKNSIPLPPPVMTSAHTSAFRKGGYASVNKTFITGVPGKIKSEYEEVMQKMKNYPSIEFPAPPEEQIKICQDCDGIEKNKAGIEKYKWEKEFSGYEYEIIQKSAAISRTLEALALNNDPEARQIMVDLKKAINFAYARLKNKVDLLIKRYGTDFTRLPTVFQQAISVERQKQLMGCEDPQTYSETMAKLVAILDGDTFDKYLEQQMRARNYNVGLNMAFIIGIERQRQLLGGKEDDSKVNYYIERIRAFNRFKIEIEADIFLTCNDDDGTCKFVSAQGKIETNKDQYVSFAPDTCGRFRLFLTNSLYNPEKEKMNSQMYYLTSPVEMDIYSLGLTAAEAEEKYTFVDDEGNVSIRTIPLAGAKLLMHLPISRISFCDDKKDTIFLNAFYNKGAGMSGEGYILAREMNLIYATVPQEELEKYVPEIVENQKAYEERMKNFDVQPTGSDKLDKLQNQFTIVETFQQHASRGISTVMSPEASIVFDAENGSEEIVNGEADMSGKNVENIKINKGIVKIKIVHDPLDFKK